MASKLTGLKSIAKGLTVKLVKKAGMWVATYPSNGKTVQQWFDNEPTEEQLSAIKDLMVRG
jgi:hypothetical protein